MTTKEKALALMNEVREKWGLEKRQRLDLLAPTEHALYVAVELLEQEKVTHADRLVAMHSITATAETQHEATKQELHDFRQEVSVSVKRVQMGFESVGDLYRFIIPESKPDPLFDVLWDLGMADDRRGIEFMANRINDALIARGLEIREKNDG